MDYLDMVEEMDQGIADLAEALGKALLPLFEAMCEIGERFCENFLGIQFPRCRFCGCTLILTISYTCDRCGGPSRFWQPWMAVRAP